VQEVGDHLRRHRRRIGADALGYHAVVPGHHDDRLPVEDGPCLAGDPGQADRDLFQPSEAAGWLGERVLPRARPHQRRLVERPDRGDGVQQTTQTAPRRWSLPLGGRKRLPEAVPGRLVASPPRLVRHHLAERETLPPARRGEGRACGEGIDIAEAEVGHGDDVGRDAEDRVQARHLEDADPADPDPLGTRGQPEILHRAAGAVDIGLGDAVATEDLTAACRIAGDAEIERCFRDAFQLQREVVRAARFVVEAGRRLALALEQGPDRRAGLGTFDDEEVPRLHEADRAGMVRRIEDAREDVVRDRVGAEGADVASPEDRFIDAPTSPQG